ncbi:MAG: hypothetical protein D6791_18225 [Chloroflexi bacterium]|nr:MAG: hypothetical protein D6791_18225 [Chloroflexota bacterium]
MEIHTTYESVDDQGRVWYHSQQPIGKVECQMREVLDQVRGADGKTANELLEWIAWFDKEKGLLLRTKDSPFPQGNVQISVRRGGSEGWIINILVGNRDEAWHEIGAIKFLTDPDLVFAAAKALTLAFEDGLFGYEPPPS